MNAGGPRLVTSVHAAPVRRARRLLKRAYRAQDGAFLVEGPPGVREALRAGVLRELFGTPDALDRHRDLAAAARAQAGLPLHEVSEAVLASLSDTVTPQGMVGICPLPAVTLAAALVPPVGLVALLAAVRDPGNAGTVIRTADAAGAGAVVLTDASVDPYNGKCVRASAGSLFHLPVVAGVAAPQAVAALHDMGCQVLAAAGDGDLDLDEADRTGVLSAPTAWLFGNEAWGLPAPVRALADRVVAIPIYGRAESLNLSSAAAVCLYASARAQGRTAAG